MSQRYFRFSPLSTALLMAAFVPAGRAQTGTQTTVLTSPAGPQFSVDGTVYYDAMSAFWPVGSEHTLSVPAGTGYSYDQAFDTQWQFTGWQWATGSSSLPTINVIGNIGSSRFTAMFNIMYLFTTQVACSPGPCSGVPGVVMVNGAVPTTPALWVSPGSAEALFPAANAGWIFAGWQIGGQTVSSYQTYTATVNGPTTVTALFIPSKPVSIVTNPPGLGFYADGVLVYSPTTLNWELGSSHIVSGLNLTNDNTEKRWVFSSWSDGGAQTHTYVVGNNFNAETLTCNYAAAAYPVFFTTPVTLDLVVDGQTLPPPYQYVWGVGSTHTISAPTPQTDSAGNTWIFQQWDDGVTTPTRTVTIPVGADLNGYNLIAQFTQQANLTVNSTISGQAVTVNGSSCTTPCNLTFKPGVQVRAAAPATVPESSGSRQNLLGWSTGGAAPVAGDWVAPLNSANTSITATYQLMNSLTTASNPPNAATWRLSPPSSNGFYDAQTKVEIRVVPNRGYRFSGWSGDLSGSDPSASLVMNAPHNVTALLVRAPLITNRGRTDSDSPAVAPMVAAGSAAAISGGSLANASQTGPASPLSATLAGVTVHIGARSLPLYFVTPNEIGFQVPPDLAPGDHTVTISSAGMPDIASELSVSRNAPGLFPAEQQGQTYAMATHEDGTPVTATAPARPGELLTAYGTGFGPTDHPRLEGSAIPPAPRYFILDPVTVQVGSGIFKAESAFAAPGQVGVDAVQFRLDSSAPSGTAVPVSITVNGVQSNTLLLPIQ